MKKAHWLEKEITLRVLFRAIQALRDELRVAERLYSQVLNNEEPPFQETAE